jgi:hypothetical protein
MRQDHGGLRAEDSRFDFAIARPKRPLCCENGNKRCPAINPEKIHSAKRFATLSMNRGRK